jgi:hypothetical protein
MKLVLRNGFLWSASGLWKAHAGIMTLQGEAMPDWADLHCEAT